MPRSTRSGLEVGHVADPVRDLTAADDVYARRLDAVATVLDVRQRCAATGWRRTSGTGRRGSEDASTAAEHRLELGLEGGAQRDSDRRDPQQGRTPAFDQA
jgi:hypothetical protein